MKTMCRTVDSALIHSFCDELLNEYWSERGDSPENVKKAFKAQKKSGTVVLDIVKEYPPKEWTDWHPHVREIENIEKDDNGKLIVYVIWNNGNRTVHSSTVVNEKCPQKMLKFYEGHIKFKHVP